MVIGFDGEETAKRRTERDTFGGSVLRWRRLYHSRAVCEEQTGFSRYREHKRQGVTPRLLTTRGFPPTRAGVRALRPSPRPRFGPSALLATARRFLQAGWNRGVCYMLHP